MSKVLEIIKQKAASYNSNALLIEHDGQLICEYYSTKLPGMIETMSVTKSIVGTVVGRLLTLGKLQSVDQCVSEFFPKWKGTEKENITIRQVMGHTSGLADKTTPDDIYAAADIVKLALEAKLVSKPGEEMFYNNKAVNLLPAIVERASGQNFIDFIKAEVFSPLEIEKYSWQKDSVGNYFAFAGLHLRARDLLKFGQLILHQGRWKDEQFLSKEFVKEATSRHHSNAGLLWWLDEQPPVVFAARGYHGQYIFICPFAQLICVRQIDDRSFNRQDQEFSELDGLFKELALELHGERISPPPRR